MTSKTQANSPNYSELARRAFEKYDSDKPRTIAVDTETTGVAFFDEPFCVTVAWDDANGGTIPLEAHYIELTPENHDIVDEMLSATESLVFHNAKFDLQKLILSGHLERSELRPEDIEDTEACAHLLDEHQLKGLKKLAKELLGEDAEETEEIKKARRAAKLKKADGYYLLPREVLIPYAVKDAEYTLRLYRLLKPQIEAIEDLHGLYRAEMELCLVLLDMEAKGMGVDLEYADKTAKEYNKQILAQKLLIQDITGDPDLNPNSPVQVIAAFDKLGVPLESTNKLALRHVEHPLAKALLELRSLSKMHGTYLKPIVEEQRDGIMHPWFRQHRTVTGRMASGGVEDA